MTLPNVSVFLMSMLTCVACNDSRGQQIAEPGAGTDGESYQNFSQTPIWIIPPLGSIYAESEKTWYFEAGSIRLESVGTYDGFDKSMEGFLTRVHETHTYDYILDTSISGQRYVYSERAMGLRAKHLAKTFYLSTKQRGFESIVRTGTSSAIYYVVAQTSDTTDAAIETIREVIASVERRSGSRGMHQTTFFYNLDLEGEGFRKINILGNNHYSKIHDSNGDSLLNILKSLDEAANGAIINGSNAISLLNCTNSKVHVWQYGRGTGNTYITPLEASLKSMKNVVEDRCWTCGQGKAKSLIGPHGKVIVHRYLCESQHHSGRAGVLAFESARRTYLVQYFLSGEDDLTYSELEELVVNMEVEQ